MGIVKIQGKSADMRCMEERRSEARMLCADMVKVSWKDAMGKRQRMVALLEDISASGACLQLEVAMATGIRVKVESEDQEFVGHVRYCVYREIGYFIGLQFEADCKWSRKAFKPQHLLDLQDLASKAK